MGTTNASIQAALGRAHVVLLEDLRRLEDMALSTSGMCLEDLRARLDATRRHVTEHFRFEEQNGYLDVISKREPRLERAIRHLAGEHHQLTQALEGLVAASRTAADTGPALREGIRAWVGQVRRHEARENDLVLDAFNQDIGQED